jgi:hypothetical protein
MNTGVESKSSAGSVLRSALTRFRKKGSSLPVTTGELQPDYLKLIGECYIQGIMDGEATEWQNNVRSEARPRMFEIR